jgi:sulfide dehydrogenase [flavocytochrome c] flavoprotein subunit
MDKLTRREFVKYLGASGAVLLAGYPMQTGAAGKSKARVVVIGGGYGGATAAKYMRMLDPGIEVTLIEKDKAYVSGALSNEVLIGERDLKSLTWGYRGLAKYGVKVVHDEVTAVDPVKKTVTLKGGKSLGYDRLVMSPGIDFDWKSVEGLSPEAAQNMPHSYKAGADTLLLKKMIEAVPDGGTAIVVAPPKPFRCPPGPYERASLIAYYFKRHKPKSKVIILDPNDSFSKKALFEQAWAEHYGDKIKWVSAAEDGTVVRVDIKTKTLYTAFGEHRADVISYIPRHHAGRIAVTTGLTDESGWCPTDPMTTESALVKGIHVVGDACIAGEPVPWEMPKSAHAASTQAKVAAQAIVAAVNGQPAPTPYYVNTCYSLITPEYGFCVVHVFRIEEGQFKYVKEAGGTSPVNAPAWNRKAEARFAVSWYENIAADTFL